MICNLVISVRFWERAQTKLSHGVMVARQILVLQVGVRVPVRQQLLVGCRSGRTVRTVNPVQKCHRGFESHPASNI